MMYRCIVPRRLYYNSTIKAEWIDCYIAMLLKAVQGERNAKTSTVQVSELPIVTIEQFGPRVAPIE